MIKPNWLSLRRSPKSSSKRNTNRLHIETLEARQMLAADTALVEGAAPADAPAPTDVAPETVATGRLAYRAPERVQFAEISVEVTPEPDLTETPVETTVQSDITAEEVSGEPTDTTSSALDNEAAIDAVHADQLAGVVEQIANDLKNAETASDDQFSDQIAGKLDWEDCDVVSDLQGLMRTAYDDYSAFRALGNSHKKTCEKLKIDLDSDKAEALERIYENDLNGKR